MQKTQKITTKQLQEAISKTHSRREAAREVGVSVPTFAKLLKQHQITYPERYPEVTAEWLSREWLQTGKSLAQLSVEFNIPLSTLEHRAKATKSYKTYRYPLNRDRLQDLSDPHLYYVAGLAATDGYFPMSSDSLEIDLAGDDECELLQSILTYYECESPLRPIGNHHRMRLAYEGLQQFFENRLYIKARQKTQTVVGPTEFPTEVCAQAYVRGCIDGDGYISSKLQRLSICTASEAFLQNLRNVIIQYTEVDVSPLHWEQQRSGSYPCLNISGKKKLSAVLRWVYQDVSCFKLKRKYEESLRLMI